jgi:uncharacterized protein YqkB
MIDCLRHNFQWDVSYTYETSYSCEQSGCDQEGICRCGTIYDESINSVDINEIANKIYNSIFDNSLSTKRNNTINSILYGVTDEIEKYTIDRILRSNKVWDTSNWEIEVGGGYYGQEIESVKLKEDIIERLETDLESAFEITDLTKRIEFILNLENGWIIDEVKDSKYELQEVDRDDIIFGNLEHYKRVQREDLDFYSDRNYKGIRGIVKKDGDKWKIIDGYHRLSKTENRKVKVLVAKK